MLLERRVTIHSEPELSDFASELSKIVTTGVIFLQGNLGAGKTTFVRYLLKACGVTEQIKSPTYTLVEHYQIGARLIHHFDLYRLADPEELELIGIRDYFSEPGLSFIEWPDKGASYLPEPDLVVSIEVEGATRHLHLQAQTELGQDLLSKMDRAE